MDVHRPDKFPCTHAYRLLEYSQVCVGDVVINLNDLSIRVTSDLRVLKDHRELRHLPIMLPHQITLSRPTHEFIQVDICVGDFRFVLRFLLN